MRRIIPFLPDVFSILVLVILGGLTLRDFSERVDINLTDDTGYLVLGLRITQGALAGFGPLYSLFFKVLKQFFDDPVDLYDMAMKILIIAPPIMAYIFLRALRVQRIWALLLCGLFMFSPVNMAFITWSKISHYSICGVFLWAAVASRMKEGLHIAFTLMILSFFLGYVRPEYHLAWYLSVILLLLWWIVVRGFGLYRTEIFIFIPLALLITAFYLFIGNPMDGNRTSIAFAQQFSYNYCEWNNLDNYDWIQWRDIAKENFGEFESLGTAYSNNPEMFKRHIFYNIQQYIVKGMEGVKGIFFPPSIFSLNSFLAWIFILVLFLIRLLHIGWASWKKQALAFIKDQWLLFFGILLLSAPSVIASIVFYTREHYLVLQMPLVFFLFALILYPSSEKDNQLPRIITRMGPFIIAALLFAIRPSLDQFTTYDVWESYTYPSNRKAIAAIRTMGFTQDVRELDHEGGLAVYAGKNFKWVTAFQKEEQPYQEFIDRFHPNMYYVTKALLSNRFFYQDSLFMEIIQKPEKHGFHKVLLQPENKGYLLVSDSLYYNQR